MVFLNGQNHLKSYHKMQIDRERLRPAVYHLLNCLLLLPFLTLDPFSDFATKKIKECQSFLFKIMPAFLSCEIERKKLTKIFRFSLGAKREICST